MAAGTLTGTVVTRPLSNLPFIEWRRGKDLVYSPVLINQVEAAVQLMGKKVSFTILNNPYGPHIVSYAGFAELLDT